MTAPHHRHRGHRGHHHHGHPAHSLPSTAAHQRVAASTPPPGEIALWWDDVEHGLKAAYLAHAGEANALLDRWFGHDAPSPAAAHGLQPVAPKTAGHRLGNLSMKYETGCVPGQEAKAAATVSGGVNDPGGRSYGAYQMTSTASSGAVVLEFLKHEGAVWAPAFARLDPTAAGAFGTEWKRAATAEPDTFFTAQHKFIERTHYNKAVAKVLAHTKVDLDTAGDAVRDVVWSMSVQHGRAAKVIETALGNVAGHGHPGERDYDRALINAMYDAREAYVTKNHQAYLIEQRYVPERAGALKMLDAVAVGGKP
jgi:hypothetical protein